jgi:hypothetical protein
VRTVTLEQFENATIARVSANRRFHFFQLTWPDVKLVGIMLAGVRGIDKAESSGIFVLWERTIRRLQPMLAASLPHASRNVQIKPERADCKKDKPQ